MEKRLSFVLILLMISITSFAFALSGMTSITTSRVEQITDNSLDDFSGTIDLDSTGNPHIGWVDTAGAYYGIRSGSSWDISLIATDPPIFGSTVEHFGPQIMSLCLDSQDRPHIAWAKPPSGDPAGIQVFYSYWNGSEWITEQVTDWGDGVTQLHNVELVLDSHNKPHIVWDSRVGLWGVFYSEKNGTEWTFEAISHYDDANPSIAIDENDISYVVWHALRNQGAWPGRGLWIASRLDGTWTSEKIADGPTTGYLAIDSSNEPHIAFMHSYDLFYTNKKSGSWNITEIAYGPDKIPYACITLDSDDKPYVAWSSDATGFFGIHLARHDQQWITNDISNQLFDEIRPKIAVDTHGTVHLVWYGPGQLGQGESEIYYYTQTETKPLVLTVDADGEFDYLPWEQVNVTVVALVSNTKTPPQPVSEADVFIKIYDPEDNLWVEEVMIEKLSPGIYMWESNETVREIFWQGGKGVYTALVEASYDGGPVASDLVLFHIDPPSENKADQTALIIAGICITAIAIIVSAAIITRKKRKP